MQKLLKNWGWIAAVLLLAALAVWAFSETKGSDSYNYQGYVIDIQGNIITTLSGDTESQFAVKWYTKKTFNEDKTEISVGDCIKLSTLGSNGNIQKFSVYEGFSMEGKIVFMENQETPFILTVDKSFNYYMLYSLISAQDITYPLQTGTQVKIYYQYPLNASSKTVVADVVTPTTDLLWDLTEDEIAYIGRQGYTIAS